MFEQPQEDGEVVTFSTLKALWLRATRRHNLKTVAYVPMRSTFGRIRYKKKWVFVKVS